LQTAGQRSPFRTVPSSSTADEQSRELVELRARVSVAEDTILAIRRGDVDAVVVAGRKGPQVFTLQGAEHPYRVLIESMSEGALTLAPGKIIIYANHCFARMVKSPLEQVLGSSLRRFLSAADRMALRSHMKKSGQSGFKIQVFLKVCDGSQLPAQISMRRLPRKSSNGALFAMVVTDMTEAGRTAELLRALSRRVVEAQEEERQRVALELHDNITQRLCAILFRCQALADGLPDAAGQSKREAEELLQLLGTTAEEMERISRALRPGVLEQLGLTEAVRVTAREFADRTGVSIRLRCGHLDMQPPAETELAIFRILQEALRNVEKHARARHVTVCLKQQNAFVRLVVKDDGISFDLLHRRYGREKADGLGLLAMRERADYVDGTLKIESARGAGTKIDVLLPTRAKPAA
jgi:PAS domain S-box-containing protein